jgi:hypothetical protein
VTPRSGGGSGAALHPILVVFGGRSGSTLLMQLLGTSPRIAFDRVAPFENRYLTYLVRWSQLLRVAPPTDEWNQTTLAALEEGTGPMGPIPLGDAPLLAGEGVPPLWPDALRAVWAVFSGRAGAFPPQAGVAPTHYAEKTPPYVRDGLSAAGIDHHALYPVRDPRDIYLSIMGMGSRRGGSFWGFREDDTPEVFARRFSRSWRSRLQLVLGVEETERQTVVRYEEMALDLPGQAARLSRFLGVELDAGPVLERSGEFRGHMTSGSATASVARWKRDLSPEVADVFERNMGDLLAALGYEV